MEIICRIQMQGALQEREYQTQQGGQEKFASTYERGYVPEGGMELDSIMPPLNPFDPQANRAGKIQTVVDKLKAFFQRFAGISDGNFGGTVNINVNIHNHFDGEIDQLTINSK